MNTDGTNLQVVNEQDSSQSPLALDAGALARALRVSLRHIRRMDSAGKLPKPLKIGKCVRWIKAETEAWLAAGAPDRRTWEQMKSEQARRVG